MSRTAVRLLDVGALKAHEQIKEKKARHLLTHMRRTRVMPQPILVDEKTGVILDGHHRYWACRELGCKVVPCCVVDYLSDERITVMPRKQGQRITKEEIIRRALAGDLFPPKSSKHVQKLEAMHRATPISKLV